ncbi:MAG: lysine--tRNA ligase [Bryobacterales bacterium]|nr:lysine--tRNA ligase [Bryobacteraceae bacterium]MDW8355878.1 lysine--tRNA ligase [Bryobacterales bacterium]
MPLGHELLAQRIQRLREIQALGFQPYGRRYDFTHTIPEIVSRYGDKDAEELNPRVTVRVCGRIHTIRHMGKAGFAHLHQGGERLQIYVRQDSVPETHFRLWRGLDAGDIIGAEGYLFRTRTGELTVHVERLEHLAKTLLNMPEKWHGLEDVETRYRQRYLDLIANLQVRQVFLTRSRVIASFRRQLEARGFLEVETPMMQPLYGGATARPFVTHHNALDMDLYLRIAPELYLKRLVVGGLDRVYEINRNFRNEGISAQHNPEFTMLEFYQAYTDYRGLMDFSEELLRQVAVDATGSTEVEYQGQKLDFGRLRRLSLREAVLEYWEDGERPTPEQLTDPEWLKWRSTRATPGEALQDLFERVAEKHLIQPTIVYDYPVETSPLAKNKPDEPQFVERFEIYAAGMEIANAYTELNDPLEQLRRFQAQLRLREKGDEEAHQMDEDFLRALCYGMPPTAGEGIGIDRLVMVLTNCRSIRDVILFPLLRPEGPIGLAERLRALDGC